MNRRHFLSAASCIAAGILGGPATASAAASFPTVRTPPSRRRFKSEAVERVIRQIKSGIGNQELAWMFENCFPNTLDTTVDFSVREGLPDTYVITGDIDAMWLRDSTAQVWPYLPLMKDDDALRQLIAGVIRRQTRSILKDPYANAFYKDGSQISTWKDDLTEMKPGVHERKWEVDSLCFPIRLAFHYWKTSGDAAPLDAAWRKSIAATLQTFREQQRKTGHGPYRFQRRTTTPTDSLPGGGYGRPIKPVGLICSMFRPSDDSTVFPFLVPANFFAVVSLRQAAQMLEAIHSDRETATSCRALADEVETALKQYAIVERKPFGQIYAYEVDGYGNSYCVDDSNVPGLLSLPYYGGVPAADPVYQNTRRMLLSDANPYYFKGRAAEGPGGPHAGPDMIWPLGVILRAVTSTVDSEIHLCLETLRRTHAGTGFMHEAFHKDDAKRFTRAWFAWANTAFGELILQVYRERPQLLS
jgi:meiotically up-regulated gene 157 (Mug157) protein